MNRAWFEPVKKWLQYSSQDLIAAREIASRDDLHPRIACFLSQQSVEKSLKVILSLNNVQFRKTHDLEQLLFDVPEEASSYFEHLDIGWLTNT